MSRARHVVLSRAECPRATPAPVHELKPCPQRGGLREVAGLADVLPLGPHGGRAPSVTGATPRSRLLWPGKACPSASAVQVPGSGLPAPRTETEPSGAQPPISWCFLTAPSQGGHPFSRSVGRIETQRRWGLVPYVRPRGAELGLAPRPVWSPSQPAAEPSPGRSRGREADLSPSLVPDLPDLPGP